MPRGASIRREYLRSVILGRALSVTSGGAITGLRIPWAAVITTVREAQFTIGLAETLIRTTGLTQIGEELSNGWG